MAAAGRAREGQPVTVVASWLTGAVSQIVIRKLLHEALEKDPMIARATRSERVRR
jgi:hypothetical protein